MKDTIDIADIGFSEPIHVTSQAGADLEMEDFTSRAGVEYAMEGTPYLLSANQRIAACEVPEADPVSTYSTALPGFSLFRICRSVGYMTSCSSTEVPFQWLLRRHQLAQTATIYLELLSNLPS